MKHTLTLLLFIITLSASSQVLNIEKFRLDRDTSKYWAGNIGLGLSLKKQVTSVNTYAANARLAYLSEKHAFMTLNNFKVIQNGEVNLISEGYTHWRATFSRRHFLSYETFGQAQYDMGRGLYHRYLGGACIRFDLKSQDKYDVALSSGFFFEHERWQGQIERFQYREDTTVAVTSFIKSTTSLTSRFKLADHVTFFGVAIYQARPDYFFKPRLILDGQLVFHIKKRTAFTSELQLSYDALPAIEVNRYLYKFEFGLLIKFE